MIKRIAIGIAAFSAALGLLAGPANAAATPASAVAGVPTHNVTTQCSLSPGVVTNAPTVTYVVEGTADAWSTNGSFGLRTALTCYVMDSVTGATYGSFSAVSDSPHVHVAGAIVTPLGSHPYACARASAWFSDAVMATHNDC